ncbi:CGNR zinc finger domain-containing protein [Shinella sp.]|uniref:CGNR zinc finger domain-containing protein n=1 Tax=Shinella sp. TaxID=1870904 RepID=UPI003F6F8949
MNKPLTVGDFAFRFTSNRLCLDFLATIGEVGHRNIERIGSPQQYSSWISAAGLVDGEPLIGTPDVAEAIEFRGVLRAYFTQLKNGDVPEASLVRAINAAARRPPPRWELNDGGLDVSRRADAAGAAALSSVARDVLMLVSEKLHLRVKQCQDPTCNMFFLDTSRGNNRIWCATEGRGCGNKAKKRAFRSRQRELL